MIAMFYLKELGFCALIVLLSTQVFLAVNAQSTSGADYSTTGPWTTTGTVKTAAPNASAEGNSTVSSNPANVSAVDGSIAAPLNESTANSTTSTSNSVSVTAVTSQTLTTVTQSNSAEDKSTVSSNLANVSAVDGSIAAPLNESTANSTTSTSNSVSVTAVTSQTLTTVTQNNSAEDKSTVSSNPANVSAVDGSIAAPLNESTANSTTSTSNSVSVTAVTSQTLTTVTQNNSAEDKSTVSSNPANVSAVDGSTSTPSNEIIANSTNAYVAANSNATDTAAVSNVSTNAISTSPPAPTVTVNNVSFANWSQSAAVDPSSMNSSANSTYFGSTLRVMTSAAPASAANASTSVLRVSSAATTSTTKTTTTTTTTKPTTTTSLSVNNMVTPQVSSVWPLYGPVAGGTVITITGQWLNKSASSVFLNNSVCPPNGEQSYNQLKVTTPSVSGSPSLDAFQHLAITVQFSPDTVNTGLYFDYRSNPTVQGITPTKHLISGGTLMTITGTNMNAAAVPYAKVATVVQTYTPVYASTAYNADTIKNQTGWLAATPETYASTANCINVTSQTILCPMPKIKLPEDFLNATKNMTVVGSAGNVPITGLNGKDQAYIYVGVVFDGYQNYNNFTSSLPQVGISFLQPPTIKKLGRILNYDPDSNYIDIPGQRLTDGCEQADYRVSVGFEQCVIKSLTDSRLQCYPPKTEPIVNSSSERTCRSVNLSIVVVQIGTLRYNYACIRYQKQSNSNIALIVGLSVGVGTPVVALFIVSIICLIRKCNSSDSQPTEGHRSRLPLRWNTRRLPVDHDSKFNRQSTNLHGPGKSSDKESFYDQDLPSISKNAGSYRDPAAGKQKAYNRLPANGVHKGKSNDTYLDDLEPRLPKNSGLERNTSESSFGDKEPYGREPFDRDRGPYNHERDRDSYDRGSYDRDRDRGRGRGGGREPYDRDRDSYDRESYDRDRDRRREPDDREPYGRERDRDSYDRESYDRDRDGGRGRGRGREPNGHDRDRDSYDRGSYDRDRRREPDDREPFDRDRDSYDRGSYDRDRGRRHEPNDREHDRESYDREQYYLERDRGPYERKPYDSETYDRDNRSYAESDGYSPENRRRQLDDRSYSPEVNRRQRD